MTDSPALTPRQGEVAALIGSSFTNKQIAARLSISLRQVEEHVSAIAITWDLDRSKNLRVQIALRVADRRSA